MFCKKCEKEMKPNATFCHECGTKVEQNEAVQINPIDATAVQSAIPGSADTRVAVKTKSNKKILIIIGAIVLFIIIIVATFGEDNENDMKSNGTQDSKEIEQQIYDILNTTPVTEGYSATIGLAITAAFTDYSVEFKEWGNDTTFNVNISGNYLPNPEVAQYTQSGEITYMINIEKGTCTIKSDPYDIQSVLLVYVVNYL